MTRSLVVVLAAALLVAVGGASAAITPGATDGAAQLVVSTRLHGSAVMQSMAYDAAHDRYYFAQVAGDRTKGNELITKTTTTGRVLGEMLLLGFGHGANIGVEPVGKSVYLWTDALAQVQDGTVGPLGAGTAIARFPFRSGRTITATSPGVQIFHDNPQGTRQTPHVDMATGTIVVRYVSAALGYPRFAEYRLSDFKAHHYNALMRVDEPEEVRDKVFQGWTYGFDNGSPVFFTIEGTGNNDDTVITSFGPDGTAISRYPEHTGTDLEWHEPEGLEVVDDHLCFGRASGPAGDRVANLFCK
jgi:hypothetical protein